MSPSCDLSDKHRDNGHDYPCRIIVTSHRRGGGISQCRLDEEKGLDSPEHRRTPHPHPYTSSMYSSYANPHPPMPTSSSISSLSSITPSSPPPHQGGPLCPCADTSGSSTSTDGNALIKTPLSGVSSSTAGSISSTHSTNINGTSRSATAIRAAYKVGVRGKKSFHRMSSWTCILA